MYTVRVKTPDMSRFSMVTPSGYTTSRRIHAAGFADIEDARQCERKILGYCPEGTLTKVGKL